MAAGNYDHPAYTARFYMSTIATTAGANGTSVITPIPNAVRLRAASAVVVTAGTSATSGNCAIILNGTTSVGQINLGTGAAGTIVAGADMNSALAAGAAFAIKNGTDATGVCRVTLELHGDPSGSFS